MKKFIEKELLKLSTGELASVFAFWFCYFIWFKEHTVQVIYSLTVLCLVLLQGSVYWFICLKRLTNKNITFNSTGKYYFWGVFLILFAIIKFINYFLVRLSYTNIGLLISQIKTRSLRKSKLAKEIEISRL